MGVVGQSFELAGHVMVRLSPLDVVDVALEEFSVGALHILLDGAAVLGRYPRKVAASSHHSIAPMVAWTI